MSRDTIFQVQGAHEETARPRGRALEESRSVAFRVLMMYTYIKISDFIMCCIRVNI